MNGLLMVLRLILMLFAKNADSSPVVLEKKEDQPAPPKPVELLTLHDLITSSGKYLDRANSRELTQDVLDNLQKLLSIINPFLYELGLTSAKVSSGFRPSNVNAGIANAAKKSLHMVGKAVDLEDADGSLDALVESHDDLKKRHGLWQESPLSTKGWCHLDIGIRSAREKNIFLP